MSPTRRLNWPLLGLGPVAYRTIGQRDECWDQGHEILGRWSVDPDNHEQLYCFMVGAYYTANLSDDANLRLLVREIGYDDASLAYLRHLLADIWSFFAKLMYMSIPFEGTRVSSCRAPIIEPSIEEWRQVTTGLNATLVAMREESCIDQAAAQQHHRIVRQAFGPSGPGNSHQVLNLLRGAYCLAVFAQGGCSTRREDDELAYSMIAYGYQSLILDNLPYLPYAVATELETGEEGL